MKIKIVRGNKRINRTFALIIPRFEDIFHSFYAGEILKGVGLAASRLKIDILVHISDRYEHYDWLEISKLEDELIEGIIFADINSDVDTLWKVINQGIPYVVLNNFFTEPINCVAIDNEKAGYEVTNHLIKLGHKNVATIAGELSTQAGFSRLEGYKKALMDNGLPVREEYITVGDFLRTPAREASKKLLSLKDRPSAIFAASDVMALEFIDEAKKEGLRIPDDLSVVGFDDNPVVGYSSVKLSTVSQPLVEMGRLGLEHLHQLASKKEKLPLKVLLSTKFIERESIKPVGTL